MWKALVISAALTFTTAAPIQEAVASDAATQLAAVVKLTPREYAKRASRSSDDYRCLMQLWMRESNWNPKSKNKHSSAFGIAQMLNERSRDPYVQINHGLRYIEERYGTACAAWSFWLRHRWY